jgi:hypothetical protein
MSGGSTLTSVSGFFLPPHPTRTSAKAGASASATSGRDLKAEVRMGIASDSMKAALSLTDAGRLSKPFTTQ